LVDKSTDQGSKILYLFTGYEAHDLDKLKASCYGRSFINSSKNGNVRAIVCNFSNEEIPDTDTIDYVKCNRKLAKARVFTISKVANRIRKIKPDLVVMGGAPDKVDLRFLFRIFCPQQRFAVVMATPSVSSKRWLGRYQNSLLKFNLLFFNNILITKEWRFDRMTLPRRKIRYYELGFYDFGYEPKDFSVLKLVYLGVFTGREIEKTIQGLALFLRTNPNAKISYDIAGKDTPQQAELMKQTIHDCGLQDIVKYHGFLPQEEASKLIKSCNVGVSYVPNNGVFGYSSTKTIEYLISGLPVIGTSSVFKEQFINDSNGVLHEDNAEAFAKALETINARRYDYDSAVIRKMHLHLTSESKSKNGLLPLLKSLAVR